MFPAIYRRAWNRFVEVSDRLPLKAGAVLLALGVLLSGVGGACLDDTLFGVDDCRSAGTVLLCIGPSAFAFGFFLVVLACDWTWPGENTTGLSGQLSASKTSGRSKDTQSAPPPAPLRPGTAVSTQLASPGLLVVIRRPCYF
eukprot:COSAG01_NODE_43705_length_427_cov_0.728659_1_plen_141_part_11